MGALGTPPRAGQPRGDVPAAHHGEGGQRSSQGGRMKAKWKTVWTIARREIRGYFDYPTAYILIIAFLGLGLFLTLRSIMGQQEGTLRPFFDLLPWLLAIFVPAI